MATPQISLVLELDQQCHMRHEPLLCLQTSIDTCLQH